MLFLLTAAGTALASRAIFRENTSHLASGALFSPYSCWPETHMAETSCPSAIHLQVHKLCRPFSPTTLAVSCTCLLQRGHCVVCSLFNLLKWILLLYYVHYQTTLSKSNWFITSLNWCMEELFWTVCQIVLRDVFMMWLLLLVLRGVVVDVDDDDYDNDHNFATRKLCSSDPLLQLSTPAYLHALYMPMLLH